MDLRALTIADVATALGYPKPSHHRQRVCADCGGRVMEFDDVTAAGSPFSTGILLNLCEDCGTDADTGARP